MKKENKFIWLWHQVHSSSTNDLQSAEQQAVWISLMMWSKVVKVEYPDSEDSVIGTNTHVCDCHPGH